MFLVLGGIFVRASQRAARVTSRVRMGSLFSHVGVACFGWLRMDVVSSPGGGSRRVRVLDFRVFKFRKTFP